MPFKMQLKMHSPGALWRAAAAFLEIGLFAAALIGGLIFQPRAALRELAAWRGIDSAAANDFSVSK